MVRVDAVTGTGLSKTSAADAFQVRSFSTGRFVARIGGLSRNQTDAIADAIGDVVGTSRVAEVAA